MVKKKKKPKRGAKAPRHHSKKDKPKARLAKSYSLKAPSPARPIQPKEAPRAPAASATPEASILTPPPESVPMPEPPRAAEAERGAGAVTGAESETIAAETAPPASEEGPLAPAASAAAEAPAPFAPLPETLQGWLDEGEQRLAEAGIETPRLDAQLLIAAVLGVAPSDLRFAEDRPIDSRDGQRIENFLRRRVKTREPVSRILGRREFWSLDFRVTPAVLDPRPDSETLIETALAAISDPDATFAVLDLGTGSGCLMLAVLHERPNAVGLGTDISEQALAVARGNADRLGLGDRVEFRRSDWGSEISEAFDLVLCNPPYIAESERESLAPEVARHDPRGALFAGADGLDAYRVILPELPRLLAPGGFALFEIGATQAPAVSEIARAAGLDVVEIIQDLAGRDRCVVMNVASD